MPAGRVVVVADPVLGEGDEIRDGWPRSRVDEFLLVSGEGRFADRVVVADVGAAERTADAVAPAVDVELAGRVLREFNRSEWKITPFGGRRVLMAMSSASVTRLVRM